MGGKDHLGVRRGPEGPAGPHQLVGELATAWEWTDDRTLRFTLREGVTFHKNVHVGVSLPVAELELRRREMVDETQPFIRLAAVGGQRVGVAVVLGGPEHDDEDCELSGGCCDQSVHGFPPEWTDP